MIVSLHAARLLVFLPLALGFILQANPGAGQARVEKTANELGSPSLAKADYENDRQIADKKPPDYRVWRVLGPFSKGVTLAFVSLSPKHFNAQELTALAASLNTRFKKRRKLQVILFDDPVFAEIYARGNFDPIGMENEARGEYYLDRTIPEEYIQFSKVKGRRFDEIKITLQPKKSDGCHLQTPPTGHSGKERLSRYISYLVGGSVAKNGLFVVKTDKLPPLI